MAVEAARPESTSWTMMLADVIALMLAFFVLNFAMREIDPAERPPAIDSTVVAAPQTIGALDTAPTDQLRAAERRAARLPSFAYLAAILLEEHGQLEASRVRHDDRQLQIELAPAGAPSAGGDEARLLMSMAFLARRFDLTLSVEDRSDAQAGLDARAASARALGAWLGEAAGPAATEVVFALPNAQSATDRSLPRRATLAARPAAAPEQPTP